MLYNSFSKGVLYDILEGKPEGTRFLGKEEAK